MKLFFQCHFCQDPCTLFFEAGKSNYEEVRPNACPLALTDEGVDASNFGLLNPICPQCGGLGQDPRNDNSCPWCEGSGCEVYIG